MASRHSNFDYASRLAEITSPTLILCGRHDPQNQPILIRTRAFAAEDSQDLANKGVAGSCFRPQEVVEIRGWHFGAALAGRPSRLGRPRPGLAWAFTAGQPGGGAGHYVKPPAGGRLV